MSEDKAPMDRDKVTWRSVVMVSFCIIGALLVGVLARIEKTADIASSVQVSIGVLSTRMDTTEREVGRIRDFVYRARPASNEGRP